jgi:phenylpyruvate tautomerase PptA (4-oxalocrotonate tautomerase family)
MFDTGAHDTWPDEWWAGISAHAQRSAQLASQVSELLITELGAEGAIEVTVGGSGVLTDLRLTERAGALAPAALAHEILATMRRAQGRLAGRVAELANDTVGADTELGRAVVDTFTMRFPVPTEEAHDAAGGGHADR